MPDKTTGDELKKLRAILRLHQSIGANLDLEKVCRIAVREFVDAMSCDICTILAVKGDKFEILAGKGVPVMAGAMTIDSYAPSIKHIISTKKEISTGDVTRDQVAGYVPGEWSVTSLICSPIMVSDEVRGIIQLGFAEKNAFSHDGLELVRLLANEISVAFERSFLYSEAVDLSIKDGLTDCLNRRKFDIDITAEVARAGSEKKPLSLLMIDIDWFKKYNDLHGHPKGDIILKLVAATLTSNIRALDTVYRYGGEEFAILLPDTTKQQASMVAERLHLAVKGEPFEGEAKSQPGKKLTISIGLAAFPADANHVDDLVKAADSALYEAKQAGRDRVCTFLKR